MFAACGDAGTSTPLPQPTTAVTTAAASTTAAANGNANATVGGVPQYAVASVATAISEAVGNLEFVNPGWWGIAAGGSSQYINTLLADGKGVSTDQSTLNNFSTALDFLDFSTSAWGAGAQVNGLSFDNGAAIGHVAGGLSSATGTAVNAVQVGNGGTMAGTGPNPADFFILSEGNFLNAQSVATALAAGTYVINHSTDVAGTDYDVLIAYQGTDGNAHIADMHWLGAGNTTIAGSFQVQVSDIVNLVGVSINQLAGSVSATGATGPNTAGHVHIIT